eukprot:Platyproteum_vivax@DN7475_c1_g3_i1.p1
MTAAIQQAQIAPKSTTLFKFRTKEETKGNQEYTLAAFDMKRFKNFANLMMKSHQLYFGGYKLVAATKKELTEPKVKEVADSSFSMKTPKIISISRPDSISEENREHLMRLQIAVLQAYYALEREEKRKTKEIGPGKDLLLDFEKDGRVIRIVVKDFEKLCSVNDAFSKVFNIQDQIGKEFGYKVTQMWRDDVTGETHDTGHLFFKNFDGNIGVTFFPEERTDDDVPSEILQSLKLAVETLKAEEDGEGLDNVLITYKKEGLDDIRIAVRNVSKKYKSGQYLADKLTFAKDKLSADGYNFASAVSKGYLSKSTGFMDMSTDADNPTNRVVYESKAKTMEPGKRNAIVCLHSALIAALESVEELAGGKESQQVTNPPAKPVSKVKIEQNTESTDKKLDVAKKGTTTGGLPQKKWHMRFRLDSRKKDDQETAENVDYFVVLSGYTRNDEAMRSGPLYTLGKMSTSLDRKPVEAKSFSTFTSKFSVKIFIKFEDLKEPTTDFELGQKDKPFMRTVGPMLREVFVPEYADMIREIQKKYNITDLSSRKMPPFKLPNVF